MGMLINSEDIKGLFGRSSFCVMEKGFRAVVQAVIVAAEGKDTIADAQIIPMKMTADPGNEITALAGEIHRNAGIVAMDAIVVGVFCEGRVSAEGIDHP